MEATLLIGNDQLLKVVGVQDAVSLDYITTAIVTATIKTLAGVAVAGEVWPITLQYVEDWGDRPEYTTDGNYEGILEDGITLENNKRYIAEVGIDAGGDLIAFYRFVVPARYRTPDLC